MSRGSVDVGGSVDAGAVVGALVGAVVGATVVVVVLVVAVGGAGTVVVVVVLAVGGRVVVVDARVVVVGRGAVVVGESARVVEVDRGSVVVVDSGGGVGRHRGRAAWRGEGRTPWGQVPAGDGGAVAGGAVVVVGMAASSPAERTGCQEVTAGRVGSVVAASAASTTSRAVAQPGSTIAPITSIHCSRGRPTDPPSFACLLPPGRFAPDRLSSYSAV